MGAGSLLMAGSISGLASAVGFLFWAVFWEPGPAPAAALTESILTQDPDLSPEQPSGQNLGTDDPILLRPIFFQSRKPWQAPLPARAQPPAPEPAAVDEPSFVVEGIVMGDALKRVLLRRADAKESQSLEVGQSLDEWRVAAIGASGVILEKGDRRLEVSMYPKDNAVEFQGEP
jgi:hypothetical protein